MPSIGPISETILNRAPRFLRGRRIGSFLQSAGLVMDTIIQTAAEGFKLTNPLKCDVSAFPALSKDRKRRLYTTEPEVSKRYRLSRWLQIVRHDASAFGHLINTWPIFLGVDGLGTIPVMRIMHQSGGDKVATWHTLSDVLASDAGKVTFPGTYSVHVSDPSNWDFDDNGIASDALLAPAWQSGHVYAEGDLITNDGQKLYLCTTPGTSDVLGGPTGTGDDIMDNAVHWQYRYAWSRWWAVLYLTDDVVLYDDGHLYDDGTTYDGVLYTAAQIADIVAALTESNAPHAVCWGVIIASDPASFDPTATADGVILPNGNWGHIIDPTTHLYTRPVTAAWTLDRSQP